MNLSTLQKKFKDKVLGSTDPLKDFPIIENGLQKEHRFFLYQNNTISSLTDILKISYPKTLAYLGEQVFINLSHHLIFKYPPKSPCLSEFSPDLSKIIQENQMDKRVAQLADLEWHLMKSKFFEPSNTMDANSLMALSEEDLNKVVFKINPSVTLFKADYSFHTVWEDIKNLSKLSMEKKEYIITSKNGVPYFIFMEEHLQFFIKAIKKSQSLGQIIKQAEEENLEFDLSYVLGQTINNNKI